MIFFKEILPYLLAVIIATSLVVYLYKYLGWEKTIFLAIAATLVDLDHFLFGSKGFLEHPEEGDKILHGFNYGIEFTMIVILLNVFIGRHLMKTGLKNWLFPSLDKFKSKKILLFYLGSKDYFIRNACALCVRSTYIFING